MVLGRIITILFVFAVGFLHLFWPRTAWYITQGWVYKNAEPSDAALTLNVILGFVFLLFGVIIIVAQF